MDRSNNKNQLFTIVDMVDQKIGPFFTNKLPALPENIPGVLAKITPFVTILTVVLGSFALFSLLGLIAVTSPLVVLFGSTGSTQALGNTTIGLVFLGIQILLQLIAIPGLFKRQQQSWNLLFLAALVSLLFDIITLNIFNLVVSFLISFYLLYQIKPYYRN